jgi:hypothetical protein
MYLLHRLNPDQTLLAREGNTGVCLAVTDLILW